MQENFPGLKDMNFQTDRVYQVPNTMQENRPTVRYINVTFQYAGGKLNLKSFQKGGKKVNTKVYESEGIQTSPWK